ncbi:phosphatidate cytidylyltransferase [Mesoplasma chauliocola]|uniref:Phosphatidate cytidylyltransferase n=1 Tax=Mesoplasma chauliocola TaxID=216427 RepID=A0A249SN57_9MOLU|nr:phosphatidate cytidylyltransferase [Mesoplasma chauliocola]ASZ09042.1 phosphatidate cytidylyltransferase [Mesoplasma chauliocola]
MTRKNKSSETKGISLKNNNFLIRFSSSIILVALLIVFLSTAILSEEIWVHLKDENTAEIVSKSLGFIMLVVSTIILLFCVYELLNSLKIKNKNFFITIEFLALCLFLAPISSRVNLDQLFIYSYEWIKTSKLSEWYMQIIYIILFMGILFTSGILSNIEKNKLFMICVTSLIMIFGLKGFTYISLSNDYLRQGYDGIKYGYMTAIWIWVIVILTDSFAYIFGVSFGKHKMAPKISPNKSWEGAIGGLASAIAFAITAALLLFYLVPSHSILKVYMFNISENLGNGVVIVMYILIAALLSFIGQLGDLYFSFIKRKNNIKDFSNLIPGHGGVLDRLDSFMFVFLFMYLFTLIN